MKYPIDALTTETFFGHLIQHERQQRQIILALTSLLKEAMDLCPNDGEPDEWFLEAHKLFNIQKKIKVEHETRIFNAKNGHPENHNIKISVPTEVGQMPPGEIVHVPGATIDPEMNHKLSKHEESFGGEMSEEEIAAMFDDKPVRRPKGGVDLTKKEPFKGMTLDEIESWEASQNNANDIYKVKARIQNLAVGISGGNLTPVGEMMVNSFVHVVKDLYEFADTIPDKSIKIALTERVRKHESMPGTLISAASAGVKVKK